MSDALTKKRPRTVRIREDAIMDILREIKALRHDVSFFLPSERLEDYKHPEKIRAAYLKAARIHPPSV